MNDYLSKSRSVLTKPALVITIGIFLLLTIVSLLATHAQTSCTTYYQCADIQQVSTHKVAGPITYWFDNEQIEGFSFLNANDADDFRTHLRAAATDWATRTGIVITEGSAGSKVRIRVSGASLYTAANGVVDDDQSNPGKMVMTFSIEWPNWTTAGKDQRRTRRSSRPLGVGRVLNKRWGPGTIVRTANAASKPISIDRMFDTKNMRPFYATV